MTGPGLPDLAALRRRVLLTGVLTMALFLAASALITALGVSDLWLLLAVAVIWALVVRPLLRPVRETVQLRRRLAYQAWLDAREDRP